MTDDMFEEFQVSEDEDEDDILDSSILISSGEESAHNSSFDKSTRKSANDKKSGRKDLAVRKKSQSMHKKQSPEHASIQDLPTTPDTENTSLLMPAPEEPPYFMEKFSGKVCVLCNLGERSQLGQGEMLRIEIMDKEDADPFSLTTSVLSDDGKNSSGSSIESSRTLKSSPQFSNKRQKGLNKCKNPVNATEYVDELDKIGYVESIEFNMIHDGGCFFIHQACAMWSFGVQKEPNNTLRNVPQVVQQSLSRKCTFCSRFGASLACKMACSKYFHFPCVAAAGGFQIIQSCSSFCKEHLGQVPLVCSTEDINCRTCSGLGDVGNLMMCSLCGDHYHGLCIGVAQLPQVRAGWQCQSCRMCQICRVYDSTEGRSLACEQCDKVYHANCLRPVMASIPKYGWKCRCCRVCSDCGSRTPGAGASSRWHNHYTVCDSCYQQRNKGYSCPICRRAYRAAAHREMVKCKMCQKFVHSSCDSDADLGSYHDKKESNPDYEYVCSLCKTGRSLMRHGSVDDDCLSTSQDSLNVSEEMEVDMLDIKPNDVGLGKGKPFLAAGKIAKKRLGIATGAIGQRAKGGGKVGFQKRARLAEFGRKRGPKSKMRGIFGVPGVGLQRPLADSSKQALEDDEPGGENRLVLCSAQDRFVLTQDICVMCGAIGTDQEGCLISCVQCGQCYHPYCVSVKVTKVILQRGWKCLDCTSCEGCGLKSDEARLLLCDDCDISYHIYCMNPPLETVPHGNWKCKWCAVCIKCGGNEPGVNSGWMNSYTECGPCASQSNCPTCNEVYSEGELIIQCTQCVRWLHCSCDAIKNEADAEKCSEDGYICLLCRPKDTQPPHLQPKRKIGQIAYKNSSNEVETEKLTLSLDGNHFVEGVFLSEHGLQHIKSLQQEPKRIKRKVKSNVEVEKDAAILAAIESVVAGGSLDNSLEDVKLEPLDPNEEAQIYKDGMNWSSTDPAPDGFSLFTTETGQVVLRKKRQRNMQKLGIGGFAVRNRAVRSGASKNEVDDTSNTTNLSCVDNNDGKKKKPARRKPKNKLVETYPVYLQEAFFGRTLLESKTTNIKLESSSSENESETIVSDDKTIKLSMEELKMIESMRMKQQIKLLEEQKMVHLSQQAAKPMIQTIVGSQQIIATTSQQSIVKIAMPPSQLQLEIKSEMSLLDENVSPRDCDALKDVLGLPGDLLDNDLVNTIMNEGDDLTKTSSVLDDITNDAELHETLEKGVKDELNDILNSPHFNLVDCKDVEEMFKGVLTDEESQESSIMTNSLTPFSGYSSTVDQNPIKSTMMQSSNQMLNTLQSPQVNVPQQVNQHQLQKQQLMLNIQQANANVKLPSPQQQVHHQTIPLGYTSYPFNNEYNARNQFNPSGFANSNQSPQWPVPNANLEGDAGNFNMMIDNSTAQMPVVTSVVTAPNYHQKTSDRMRDDEKLEDMATISAVLYCNQNHPEMKQEFPNWTDRCKQILKKWRALSSDKKQPYLQRARENRSTVRTKKAQQIPDLSPDCGTTSSNNSMSMVPSPSLSNTMSDSSLMDVIQQQPTQASPMQQQLSQQSKVVRTPTQIQPQYQHVEQQQSVPAEFSIKEVPGLKNCNTNPFDTDNTDITLSSSNPSNTQITREDVLTSSSSSSEKLTVAPTLDMERDIGVTENATNKSDAKIGGVDTVDNVKISQTNAANISVATNIANAFINISNLNANVGGGGIINSPSVAGGPTSNSANSSNVNVIVSQPISQHFMKTLTFSTSRGGIFVPNITSTIPPQFTVHHHQFGLNSGGPAPNVTVNPNGNFNTSSNAAVRPGAPNHFRLLLQQAPNINFNIIGGKGTNKAPSVPSNQSPILEASLQTINKLAAVQPSIVSRTFTPSKTAVIQLPQNPNQSQCATSSTAQKLESNERQSPPELSTLPHQASQLNNTPRNVTPSLSDQHIRVLTPLEIMRTLPPSLSTQDVPCFKVQSTEPLQKPIDGATDIQNPNSSSLVASFDPPNSVANSPSTSNLTYTTSTNLITVTTNTTTVTSIAQQMDQDKIAAENKSMKEAEQERQWKRLQALRATQQQMGLPSERMQDPNIQLQISTLNDGAISPIASPSPNSMRGQFVTPTNKGRLIMNAPQSPSSGTNFQLPGRPMSALQQRQVQGQIQQNQQQRMIQNAFSPQAQSQQAPQSPHDLFPNSPTPGESQFGRQSAEDQFMHSPQARPSPNVTPNSNQSSSHSPAYGEMGNQQQQNNQNAGAIRQQGNNNSMDNVYSQAPGTPRPQFGSSNTSRPLVYARPGDLFNASQASPFGSPPSPQEQNNRQLRDLLQRQQTLTLGSNNNLSQVSQNIQMVQQQSSVPFMEVDQSGQVINQSPQGVQQVQLNQLQSGQSQQQQSDNPFRQPFPPGSGTRPRMQIATNQFSGGKLIRQNSLPMVMQQQRSPMTNIAENRPKGMSPSDSSGGNSQQMINMQQQALYKLQMSTNNFNSNQNEMMQQSPGGQQQSEQNIGLIDQRVVNSQQPTNAGPNQNEAPEIPDAVTAELEKLEQDDSAVMNEVEGVGDILGGLGDDDDDLLDSLTADMGADFNILEYADPELDTELDEKSNLLDSLELDENESAKDDKSKIVNTDSKIVDPSRIPMANPGPLGNLQQFPQSVNQQPGIMHQGGQLQQKLQSQQGGQMHHMAGQNIIPQSQSNQNIIITQQIHTNVGQNVQQNQQQHTNNQQIVLNTTTLNTNQQPQQHPTNIVQQQQIQINRIKAIQHGQLTLPPNIHQIQQQMLHQLQQAAASGNPMPVGTKLVSKEAGAVGVVMTNNNIQISFPSYNRTGQLQAIPAQRLQQLRMGNPMQVQGNQQQPNRMMLQQVQQNRVVVTNNPQQGSQPQHLVTQQVSNTPQGLPPPPYPEPPPPYPGQQQEQPLLLEELLEQEKREQARHIGGASDGSTTGNQLISDQDYEKLRAEAINSTNQGIIQTQPVQLQQNSLQQQQTHQQNLTALNQNIKTQFLPRGTMNNPQWRNQTNAAGPSMGVQPEIVRTIPLFNGTIQSAPQVPPENVQTDNDRRIQAAYEQWLHRNLDMLQKQQNYYETEVLKLRKSKKSLNTKQRQLKKAGSELAEPDAKELAKVTQEQSIIQKQLENSRKQFRQHQLVVQDYTTKQKAKQIASSPAGQVAPPSPLMSPSPGGSIQIIQQQQVQSPMSNTIMQPAQSPLHSPSPHMSQSPGPASVNSIMQSPGGHGNSNSAMSPFNTMQQSPRIGTPQMDENPFSPGSIESPISSRLTSPLPRMTSPQHRANTTGLMINRVPGQFNQQNNAGQNQFLSQQSRFARPQMRMAGSFQQAQSMPPQQGQQNIIVRPNQMGGFEQPQQQSNLQQPGQPHMDQQLQTQRMQIAHQRQLLMQRQMNQQNQQIGQNQNQMGQNQNQMVQNQMGQINQQQNQMGQINQQQNQMAQNQMNQQMGQYSKQSPIHQPQSPVNQNVTSPMMHYQQQQNPTSPMMRRPPSTGGMPERPLSVDNSVRSPYMPQQQQQQQLSMDQQGNIQNNMGGGMNNASNPIPRCGLLGGYVKLGLKGGAPMWGNGRGKQRPLVPPLPQQIQMPNSSSQQPKDDETKPENISQAQLLAARKVSLLKKPAPVPFSPNKMKTVLIKQVLNQTTSKSSSLVSADYNESDDSSNTPPISPLASATSKQTLVLMQNKAQQSVLKIASASDDVVVIDSSPDEHKQHMMYVDDDSDKVGLEHISLNSTADVADTDSIIESYQTQDFIPSPLDQEATEEYVLFDADMVGYVDSDDSLRQSNVLEQKLDEEKQVHEPVKSVLESKAIEKVVKISTLSEVTQSGVIAIEKLGRERNIAATTEDFEAMIDCGSKDSKEDDEVSCKAVDKIDKPIEEKIFAPATAIQVREKPVEQAPVLMKPVEVKTSIVGTNIMYTVPISISSNVMTRPNTAAAVAAHKKLVKNATQTTAKVSIGNQTISVPVLKNVPLGKSSDVQNKSQHKKIITASSLGLSHLKNPAFVNITGQKISPATIVNLSQLNLSAGGNINPALLSKALTRPLQPHRLHKPLQGQSVLLPISTALNVAGSTVLTSESHAAILGKINASRSSPSMTFAKISTLTVTQDTSLPTKIFEDDSISPNSSIEQDDADCLSPNEKNEPFVDKDCEQKLEEVETRSKPLNPVHVIVKAADNTMGPVLGPTGHRLQSIVQQLSPLSQPIEINTNTANATQQIRSIMSSINVTATSVSNVTEQKIHKVEDSSIVKIVQKAAPKLITTQLAPPMSQSSNVLLVKQITSSGVTHTEIGGPRQVIVSANKSNLNNPSIVVVSQSPSLQSPQGSVFSKATTIKNKAGNFVTILNSGAIQKNNKVRNINFGDLQGSINPTTSTSTSSPTNVSIVSTVSSCVSTASILSATLSQPKANPTITNLLNANMFKRSKSTDDVPIAKEALRPQIASKRLSLETSIKTEPIEDEKQVTAEMATGSGSKFSSFSTPTKPEDSQNVLLKQLLQNTGNSTPVSSSSLSRAVPGLICGSQRAPSLGVVSSLEAQLARPVIPPAPANQPTQITTQNVVVSTPQASIIVQEQPKPSTMKVLSRETSFLSKPIPASYSSQPGQQISVHQAQQVQQPQHKDLKTEIVPAEEYPKIVQIKPDTALKIGSTFNQQLPVVSSPTIVAIAKTEMTLLSPSTQKPTQQQYQTMSVSTPTTTPAPLESPSLHQDIKKEILDESSQCESVASDISFAAIKTESSTPHQKDESVLENSSEQSTMTQQELANELKKKKRREYQKLRRLQTASQSSSVSQKKKPRKMQKAEEDYDTFIESLMVQLRSLQPMQILEPLLPKNYSACSIFGVNDSPSAKRSSSNINGELIGTYSQASLPNVSDFYNTEPFGNKEPKPELPPASTQRGFYDQEFAPLKLDEEDHRSKYDLLIKDRDVDTPDTIVGSSSPECTEMVRHVSFPGLKLIEGDDEDELQMIYGRMSPTIPIITPIPIRLKPGFSLTADNASVENKENESSREREDKMKQGPPTPLKDSSNVTMTLTLTSSAAEDILGVLKALANILHIPPPSTYEIVERTTTPPSQKLGLYRTKGKDGKEGTPIDIQTILNGTAKFCRHCDVVILNNVIRAKASEFPLLINSELETEDLYFCSKSCYKQFQWRPIDMLDNKALNNSADDRSREHLESMMNMDNELDKLLKNESYQSLSDQPKRSRKLSEESEADVGRPAKQMKVQRYKTFSSNSFVAPIKFKKLSEKEVNDMLFRMQITVSASPKIPEDTRKCMFCQQPGDGVCDGPSRLLNVDVDKWVHLNCALWSDGVYETVNGALMNVESTLQNSLSTQCCFCSNLGATIKCFKTRCGSVYHLTCAMKDNCVFYKNKTSMCQMHAPKSEKDNELTTLSVARRVYVERDEGRQVASVMHHSDLSNLMRVGSLILLNVGQLLPHQLQAFHTPNFIYPIGYKIIRFFWSMRRPNKRCRYICSIVDICGRPEFRILVKEPAEEDIELRDSSPKAVWQRILEPIATLRKNNTLVQVFPRYVSGEDLFGLTEQAVVRILESLPGIETLTDYKFKYGRNPLLELPLAINPTGAARSEPKLKNAVAWKKPHTQCTWQRTGTSSQRPAFVPAAASGEVACPYSKQFVHSKSSQYKKMKNEWRNNVYLARSKIQGLGLYSARDLEKHTMVIEYIGEVIRGELSELREKQYEAKNRGIYMFRLDEDRVIDATLSGGLARYINHSCNPNCVTEIVEVDREYRIIIFAKRKINRGEELSYDYKFDIEDESHKIPCNCYAPNCKKWMN